MSVIKKIRKKKKEKDLLRAMNNNYTESEHEYIKKMINEPGPFDFDLMDRRQLMRMYHSHRIQFRRDYREIKKLKHLAKCSLEMIREIRLVIKEQEKRQ